jgi:hypothetical protein
MIGNQNSFFTWNSKSLSILSALFTLDLFFSIQYSLRKNNMQLNANLNLKELTCSETIKDQTKNLKKKSYIISIHSNMWKS